MADVTVTHAFRPPQDCLGSPWAPCVEIAVHAEEPSGGQIIHNSLRGVAPVNAEFGSHLRVPRKREGTQKFVCTQPHA